MTRKPEKPPAQRKWLLYSGKLLKEVRIEKQRSKAANSRLLTSVWSGTLAYFPVKKGLSLRFKNSRKCRTYLWLERIK